MHHGNGMLGAIGKEQTSHNASEGIEPRNGSQCTGLRISSSGSQQRDVRKGECKPPCRGLSPWRASDGVCRNLGEPRCSRKAADKLKKQGCGMAARQSDWLVVGE